MEKFIKNEKGQDVLRLNKYRDEVLELMYPEKGKRIPFVNACAQVLNNYGITDKVDRKRLFQEIGALIKESADMKAIIKDAATQSILSNLEADRLKKEAEKAAKEKAEKEKFPLLRHAGLMDDDQTPETRV